ncbi:MAG: hypothetical protein U0470_14055 [Anaerolineae bacterium]
MRGEATPTIVPSPSASPTDPPLLPTRTRTPWPTSTPARRTRRRGRRTRPCRPRRRTAEAARRRVVYLPVTQRRAVFELDWSSP